MKSPTLNNIIFSHINTNFCMQEFFPVTVAGKNYEISEKSCRVSLFLSPLRILLLNNKQEIKTQAASLAKSQKIF
jgi:hypothetical protein